MRDDFTIVHCPNCSNEYRLYNSMLSKDGLKITCSGCYEKFIVEVKIVYNVNVKKTI